MITTYQIRNVLRIYGNQLKKRTMLLGENESYNNQRTDIIDISSETRRKEMLNRISKKLVAQITVDNNETKEQGAILKENKQLTTGDKRDYYES